MHGEPDSSIALYNLGQRVGAKGPVETRLRRSRPVSSDLRFWYMPWPVRLIRPSFEMVRHLWREGVGGGRHRVRHLMPVTGLQAIYQAPRTTTRHPEHRVYPYFLKGFAIERPNQVWTADITYIPIQRGFLYLVAIMDWATRRVLSWRLSYTLDARFCTEALTEALEHYGRPQIFNTDQGQPAHQPGVHRHPQRPPRTISMDRRGQCMDNIFIERLWRSLKYEAVYLHELSDGFQAQRLITRWMVFYNTERPHSALPAPPDRRLRQSNADGDAGQASPSHPPLCRLHQPSVTC